MNNLKLSIIVYMNYLYKKLNVKKNIKKKKNNFLK